MNPSTPPQEQRPAQTEPLETAQEAVQNVAQTRAQTPTQELPQSEEKDPVQESQSLVTHLIELRKRVIYILIGVVVIFVLCVPFRNMLFEGFARPVLETLTQQHALIIRKPMDSFLIPMKLCLFVSVIVSLPWIVYQVWAFVAPGLYKKERRTVVPLVVSSTLLFYLGLLFAYFVVLPLAFGYLAASAPTGTTYGPDIADYFSFVFTVFFAFGVAFEVPIAIILLVSIGVLKVQSLKAKRRYIIVIAFVVGMLLTPPDMISQTLLAVPMLLLFEIGLFVATRIEKRRIQAQHN